MKSNWIKYVFFIFVVGIMIFAVYKINKDKDNTQKIETKPIQEETINRELHLGIADFDNLNPIISNNKNVQDVSRLIFDPLIQITEDYKLEPALATEWAKAEDNTYILKLRDDVKWSNGEKFTADDVQFTIDRLKEIKSVYSYNVQYVIEVNVVDSTTIKIKLNREIPFFEYYLTFPIMSSSYYKDENFEKTNKNEQPIGTGMYQVVEKKDNTITLGKNENWWQNKDLSIDKIVINLYSSAGELYNSFKMGNVDILRTDNNNIKEYIGTIGYSSKEIKGRRYDFLAINTEKPLLSKQEVRKAIAYSIDKDKIASEVHKNNLQTSNFPLDYGTYLSTENDSSSGYNANAAKQALVDAGWKYRYSYWQKYENRKTQRLRFNLVVKSTDDKMVQVAEKIEEQLEKQGIRITVIQASKSRYEKYLEDKNYDMILASMNSSLSPNMDTFFGEDNLANYKSEELSTIMQEVKNTNDTNVLTEKYKRLAEIFKTEIPYVGLCRSKETVVYNTALAGDITPNWYNLFYHIEGWHK